MTFILDPNSKYLIIGNFGNDTIALIQWALEHALKHVTVMSVDTGWAAPGWDKHVTQCENWVSSSGYSVIRLVAPTPFAELIKQHGYFPTPKFQWCANTLKGIPILTWLDQYDASGSLQILLAHRHASARSKQNLPADIPESESFGERHVYYPMIDMATNDRDLLLARTGRVSLTQRSLECNPCINSDWFDLSHLSAAEVERLNVLEMAVGQFMFAHLAKDKEEATIVNLCKKAKKHADFNNKSDVLENMGCGDPYGCGI